MKLKCDAPLSNFAFNFNLRRYTMVTGPMLHCAMPAAEEAKEDAFADQTDHKVGRCRLTLSKPELKPRLVSTLETKM